MSINGFAQSWSKAFGQTCQTGIQAINEKTIEVWNTGRFEKAEFYRGLDTSVEFGIGLHKKYALTFALQYSNDVIFNKANNTFENSGLGYVFGANIQYVLSENEDSNLGTAMILDVGIGDLDTNFGLAFVLDKNVRNHLHAFNTFFQTSISKTVTTQLSNEVNFDLEFRYGYAFRLNKLWNLGLELLNHNLFNQSFKLQHSEIFVATSLSFNKPNFEFVFSFIPQITKLFHVDPNYSHTLILDEHERMGLRLIFAFVL